MRRGTQGHVAAPRGPTRRLRGVIRTQYLYLLIYVIICIAFCLSEWIINSLNASRLINPFDSFNFLRVGLSSTEFI